MKSKPGTTPLAPVSKAELVNNRAKRLVVTHHGINDWEVEEQELEVKVLRSKSIKRGDHGSVQTIVKLWIVDQGGDNRTGSTGL